MRSFLLLLFCLPSVHAQDKLTLYCTDISGSTWVTDAPGNHTLIVPSDKPYFIHMNFKTKKAFITRSFDFDPKHPESPNSPDLGDVVVTKTESTKIQLSNASSLEKPHADGVDRLKISIDRRTGVLVETKETLKANNSIQAGSESIRVCGTAEPKF